MRLGRCVDRLHEAAVASFVLQPDVLKHVMTQMAVGCDHGVSGRVEDKILTGY